MNVLYIFDYWTKGGAPASFKEMVSTLKRIGVRPVVCVSNPVDAVFFKSIGIETITTGHLPVLFPNLFVGKKSPLRVVRYFFRFCKSESCALKVLHKSEIMCNIDLIHTNSERNDIGCLISKKYGIPHVMHIREYADLDYNCSSIRPNYISLFNRFTCKFICISEAVKNHWIKKGLSKDKMIVIYNGVRSDDICLSEDHFKYHPILKLVIVGLVQKEKGQYLAIEALANLPLEVRENIRLDIVGSYYIDYYDALMKMVEKYGLKQQVHFLGSQDHIHQLLGKYHVGLMCSRAEGFGRVTAEYMHAQLGVIASDTGANPEIIEDGVNGLLFKSGSSDSLSSCIFRLYQDRNYLVKISKEGFIKAKTTYTQEINAKNVFEMYKSILGKKESLNYG